MALLLLSVAGCGLGDRAPSEGGVATSQNAAGAVHPVVVDTDLASDDLVALLFLLSSSAVDVRAVTVSGTGEVRCPRGLDIARGLLAVTGHDDVPVACGRTTPLAGDHTFPVQWRDAADATWGAKLPHVKAPPDPPAAASLLKETLTTGGVTLLTLGPLTNPAEAFRGDPNLADRVEAVVIMGGAVHVPGNVPAEAGQSSSQSSSAEWNMYIDPVAADEVLTSGAPITLVALDATNQAPITPDFVDRFQPHAHTEIADIVGQLLADNPLVGTGQAYFWDPLAAAFLVDPHLVTTDEATIRIETHDGPDIGRTLQDPDGQGINLAVDANVDELENLLLNTFDRQ